MSQMSQMGYVETNLSFEESSDFCNDKCGQMFQTLMLETQLHNADADATTYVGAHWRPLDVLTPYFLPLSREALTCFVSDNVEF